MTDLIVKLFLPYWHDNRASMAVSLFLETVWNSHRLCIRITGVRGYTRWHGYWMLLGDAVTPSRRPWRGRTAVTGVRGRGTGRPVVLTFTRSMQASIFSCSTAFLAWEMLVVLLLDMPSFILRPLERPTRLPALLFQRRIPALLAPCLPPPTASLSSRGGEHTLLG